MMDAPGTQPMVGFYFRARKWQGTPVVREPDRCVSWTWSPANNPPQPLVPYTAAALAGIREGRLYTELGWS